MTGRYVLALLFLPSIAKADKPKHLVVYASFGEINHYSKHPCNDKKVIDEVWNRVMKHPEVTITDDSLLLKVNGKDVEASWYSRDENGDQLLNPITGHWQDGDITLGISVARNVYTHNNKGNFYKTLTMNVSVIKNVDKPGYCYEQWIGEGMVKQ